jgi:hypothetical protein
MRRGRLEDGWAAEPANGGGDRRKADITYVTSVMRPTPGRDGNLRMMV